MLELKKRIEALSPQTRKLFLGKLKHLIQNNTHSSSNERKRLVAFVKNEGDFNLDTLKKELKQKLPDYMVPSKIIPILEIPLLPNGKIDKKKLLKYSKTIVLEENKIVNASTQNSSEQKLTKIWEEVLGFSPIKNTDNFFEIGGDSILSIQIVAKARKNGIELKSNAIFEHQTIKELLGTVVDTPIINNGQTVEKEQKLTKIWEEVLGFSPIKNTDNFFEIGGDSILSIQIVAKAKKAGIDLNSNDIFEHQTINELLANIVKNPINTDRPTVEKEQKLIEIWEEVLGFSPIENTDNFFEIGGDSILSIQIVAKARKNGILLNANDIFENQTINELKKVAKTDSIKSNNDLILGEISLTPIQHWFFENHVNAPHYWNQAVKLNNVPALSENKLSVIIESLITEHDTLRSSFKKKDNTWEAHLFKPENTNALEYVDLTHLKDFDPDKIQEQYLTKIQNNFNLSEGSLFKCVYFFNEQNSFCVLLAHHLVIDAVSWQILTDRFIEALDSNIIAEPKSTSVKEWVSFLEKNTFDNEIAYWKKQLDFSKKLPYDIKDSAIIEEKDIITKSFILDNNTTILLKGTANKSYNTKTEELITAAFVGAMNEWTQNSEIIIGFEKHGRETLFNDSIDLSKTVGWLTSYFPTKFNSDYFSSGNIPQLITSTKENMRKVPNGGVGYGVLRYLKNTFGKIGNPEIVLNYLGVINNKDNAILVTPISEGLRAPSSERTYKFEINTYIKNNKFYCNWSYSKKMYSSETIELLIKNFEQKLNLIITHCNQSNTQNYTPSDFTEVDINQNDLDHLLDILD